MHPEIHQEIAWRIWLSHCGISPKAQRGIFKHFRKAQIIDPLCLSMRVFGLRKQHWQAINNPSREVIERTLKWAQNHAHHIITDDCPHYPIKLKDDAHYPSLLFAKGNLELLSQPQIAVVGSRNASPYGLTQAASITQHLAQNGWIVTSGMALGIDATAHRTALALSKASIAVLGLDVDTVYPREHQSLYSNLAKKGLILSEMPIGTRYNSSIFPRRNRIISGLAHYVVVVEAQTHSGALHTCRHALQQNRDIYALPGRIDQPQAQGCNRLIQAGAQVITCLDDLPHANNLHLHP